MQHNRKNPVICKELLKIDQKMTDRVIASHLKPLLMREILFGTLKAGGKVSIQVENGALKLQPTTE